MLIKGTTSRAIHVMATTVDLAPAPSTRPRVPLAFTVLAVPFPLGQVQEHFQIFCDDQCGLSCLTTNYRLSHEAYGGLGRLKQSDPSPKIRLWSNLLAPKNDSLKRSISIGRMLLASKLSGIYHRSTAPNRRRVAAKDGCWVKNSPHVPVS